MKRLFTVFFMITAILSLSGCIAASPLAELPEYADKPYFDARIISISGSSLLVECTASQSNAVPVGSQVSFSIARLSASVDGTSLKEGENIRIYFSGEVMETYPLQLGTVYAVVSSDGTEYR